MGATLRIEIFSADVQAVRDHAVGCAIELPEHLTEREWGLTDFRVHDPDGYYLRITDRR